MKLKLQNRTAIKDLLAVLTYYNYEVKVTNFKIVCPFHNDVNPSLMVMVDEGRWFCFGCNESGDAYSFVKKMEKKFHNETNELKVGKLFYKIVNDKKIRSSIELPHNFGQIKREDERFDNLLIATDYYYGLPKIDWGSYRLDDDEIDVRHYMLQRGFKVETLNECGCKYNFSESYKLIFPLIDNGLFKGWVCRTTNKEVEAKGRKYLYNKGFVKSDTLVGHYDNTSPLFIVEGYMDWLKLLQMNIKNAVAILGWKMSSQQIEKLKEKGVKEIVCALDNDECGRKGYEFCKNYFTTYRFQYLKNVKDIGEQNKVSFNKMLKRTEEKFKIKIKK